MPVVKLDVTDVAATTVEDVNLRLTHAAVFQWTINGSSLVLDWGRPTLECVLNNESFPAAYNVVAVDNKKPSDEWAVLVIVNAAPGIFTSIAHPIHLHGHDFWILAQEGSPWDGSTAAFQTRNPPRCDVAMLPARGYLALAFRLDNPGAWLVHCHIAWHLSQGLSLEVVESAASVAVAARDVLDDTCASWGRWSRGAPWPQDDSGV